MRLLHVASHDMKCLTCFCSCSGPYPQCFGASLLLSDLVGPLAFCLHLGNTSIVIYGHSSAKDFLSPYFRKYYFLLLLGGSLT